MNKILLKGIMPAFLTPVDENEKLIAKTLLSKAEFVKLENDTRYFTLSFISFISLIDSSFKRFRILSY